MLTVFWDYRDNMQQECTVKGTKINTMKYANILKSLKQLTNSICRGKKPMILEHDNARHHTYAVTSAAIEKIGFGVVSPHSYSLDLLPVVCSYQDICQRNSFHMWRRSSSCYGKMNLRTSSRILQWQVQKNLSSGGIVSNERNTKWEKWGTETKHTFWAMFCVLFNFDTLSGSKDTTVEPLVPEHS